MSTGVDAIHEDMQVLSGYFSQSDAIFDWCVVRWGSRLNAIKTCVLKRLDYFKNSVKYSALNREHNGENLYIQLRNQQACTFDNHNLIWGGAIFVGAS